MNFKQKEGDSNMNNIKLFFGLAVLTAVRKKHME